MAKEKFLAVRVSEEEKEQVQTLADEYGLSIGTFVRLVMDYVADKRPDLTVSGNANALVSRA